MFCKVFNLFKKLGRGNISQIMARSGTHISGTSTFASGPWLASCRPRAAPGFPPFPGASAPPMQTSSWPAGSKRPFFVTQNQTELSEKP